MPGLLVVEVLYAEHCPCVPAALSLVGVGEGPGEQGVVEEGTAERGAELGKVVWGCLAALIGDLHASLPPSAFTGEQSLAPWSGGPVAPGAMPR